MDLRRQIDDVSQVFSIMIKLCFPEVIAFSICTVVTNSHPVVLIHEHVTGVERRRGDVDPAAAGYHQNGFKGVTVSVTHDDVHPAVHLQQTSSQSETVIGGGWRSNV